MASIYQKKDYTQGHLREKIVEKRQVGKKYRDICIDLGIWSTKTINKWVHSKDLISKSSAPINPHREYEFSHLYFLYAVRKYLWLSWDDCADRLLEDYKITIKRWSVFYYLKEWWMTKKEKPKRSKFKEYEPGYLHIDISYWPTIWGKRSYIYVAIDRAMRLMYLEIHEDKKASTAAKFLQSAVAFLPIKTITHILTDNGKEFTLHNHLWKHNLQGAFDIICSELWIDHRLTEPYSPRTNGMVEKCNDTIKSNTVGVKEYPTREIMINQILSFMLYYNLYRRHGWLIKEGKWRTPFDALIYYHKLRPELFKETPEEFKQRLYMFAKDKWLEIQQRCDK